MNNYVVQEKLLKLKNYLEDLRSLKPATIDIYEQDRNLRYAVERVIQLIVDLALDINNILLAKNNKPPAADYFNSFLDLAVCGVYELEFALAIAPSTGLRNRLVHEYDKINHRIVYKSIEKIIRSYTEYIQKVGRYLEKN